MAAGALRSSPAGSRVGRRLRSPRRPRGRSRPRPFAPKAARPRRGRRRGRQRRGHRAARRRGALGESRCASSRARALRHRDSRDRRLARRSRRDTAGVLPASGCLARRRAGGARGGSAPAGLHRQRDGARAPAAGPAGGLSGPVRRSRGSGGPAASSPPFRIVPRRPDARLSRGALREPPEIPDRAVFPAAADRGAGRRSVRRGLRRPASARARKDLRRGGLGERRPASRLARDLSSSPSFARRLGGDPPRSRPRGAARRRDGRTDHFADAALRLERPARAVGSRRPGDPPRARRVGAGGARPLAGHAARSLSGEAASAKISRDERFAAAALVAGRSATLRRRLLSGPPQLSIRGADLLQAGIPPGPRVGRALERTREARAQGRIEPREELAFALDAARGEENL